MCFDTRQKQHEGALSIDVVEGADNVSFDMLQNWFFFNCNIIWWDGTKATHLAKTMARRVSQFTPAHLYFHICCCSCVNIGYQPCLNFDVRRYYTSHSIVPSRCHIPYQVVFIAFFLKLQDKLVPLGIDSGNSLINLPLKSFSWKHGRTYTLCSIEP